MSLFSNRQACLGKPKISTHHLPRRESGRRVRVHHPTPTNTTASTKTNGLTLGMGTLTFSKVSVFQHVMVRAYQTYSKPSHSLLEVSSAPNDPGVKKVPAIGTPRCTHVHLETGRLGKLHPVHLVYTPRSYSSEDTLLAVQTAI